MKYIKTLGLAAVAITALLAVAAVGSASATVLCKKTENPCAEVNKWKTGTFADGSLASSTTGKMTDTSGNTLATCGEATISGTVEGSSGSATETPTAHGTKENVRWGKCTFPMTTTHEGWVEVHHIAGTDNGTVTAKEFETTVNLGVLGSCVYTYGTGTDVGTLNGGISPTLTVNEVLHRASGAACPETVRIQGTLVLTEPKEPVYVVDG